MPDKLNKYLLVNPFFHGNIKPIYKGENSLAAANEAYKSISSYFGNNNPEFIFTLQKINSKSDIGKGNNDLYYHFRINEKRSIKNNNAVKFNLNEIKFKNIDYKNLDKFKSNFRETLQNIKKKNKKKGGGRFNYDDDDLFDDDDYDDDDDDDELFLYDIYQYPRFRNYSNIYGYYYYPRLYNRFFNSSNFLIPTFRSSIHPYIYIYNEPVSSFGYPQNIPDNN